MGKTIFEEFDGAGCSWGYNNGVFYERNLKYLGEFLTGECSLTSGNINDRSEEKISSAVSFISKLVLQFG